MNSIQVLTTAKLEASPQDLMRLQSDILIHGITETRRKRMIKYLDNYFKLIGEENIPRSQYWEYWYEG